MGFAEALAACHHVRLVLVYLCFGRTFLRPDIRRLAGHDNQFRIGRRIPTGTVGVVGTNGRCEGCPALANALQEIVFKKGKASKNSHQIPYPNPVSQARFGGHLRQFQCTPAI